MTFDLVQGWVSDDVTRCRNGKRENERTNPIHIGLETEEIQQYAKHPCPNAHGRVVHRCRGGVSFHLSGRVWFFTNLLTFRCYDVFVFEGNEQNQAHAHTQTCGHESPTEICCIAGIAQITAQQRRDESTQVDTHIENGKR